MRRRHAAKDESETIVDRFVSNARRALPQLDVYPKLEEEYRVKTTSGAALSLFMGLCIAILVVSETWHYLTPKVVDFVEVDTILNERMRIDLNITFFALQCSRVDLVAMDVAGEHQLHADSNSHMHKTRLSAKGQIIGEKLATSVNKPKRDLNVSALPPDYCGSCYGAKGKCCNSCRILRQAYVSQGWDPRKIEGKGSEQCERAAKLAVAKAEDKKQGDDEGCMLEGFMTVNKVAGNFHIALGTTRSINGRLIHAFAVDDLNHFNTSHRLDQVSFGDPFLSQSNPLNGQIRLVDHHQSTTGVFQYYVKIVPTIFVGAAEGNSPIRSSQYSFTEKFVPIGEGDDDLEIEEPGHTRKHGHRHPSVIQALPGVFFIYEMSPFQIRRTVQVQAFMEYFARLCAIVGGIYTLSGIVDSWVNHLRQPRNRVGPDPVK